MAREIKSIYLNSKGNFVPVGRLAIDREASDLYFSYDENWIETGYPLSFDLPLSDAVSTTSIAHPSFGFLVDLMPGAAARKLKLEGAKKDFNIIDLLLQSTEELRVGALTFSTEVKPLISAKKTPAIFSDMERLIASDFHFQDIDLLYEATSALPGERFKASFLNSNNLNVISKFNQPDLHRNLVVFEHAVLQMARALGIFAIDSRVIHFRGVYALLSERFDRDAHQNRIPFASAQALLGPENLSEVSYIHIADIINRAGSRAKTDLPELWSRMVFSMAIGNTRDAPDNIGFLRDAYGWRLAPMYGLTPVPASFMRRPHATGVTPESNLPDVGEAIRQAKYFNLKETEAKRRALEISQFVAANWTRFASDAGATSEEIQNMKKAFEPLDF
ncbi:MAG TPA: hypothetical protein DCW60_01235 [Sutterella sp.]|nr:hypothetical protein [Sutterella sp.]